MATSGDIRDIMDLGHDGPRPSAPKKKKKNLEMQPRLSGISREVQALMGDSVPPVAIVEAPKYKQKPSIAMRMFKPRHWEERPFAHGGRSDALQLKHWKRSIPASLIRAPAPIDDGSADVDMTDSHSQASLIPEMRFEDEFPSEKWNVEVSIKRYDDEQYDKFFKSEDWTREETDHLMQLCQDYDLRWILIADRYDPADISSTITDHALKPTYPSRKMEDLKQRYYTIAAKILELQTPASNMTQLEFQLWEKMRNFDARTETQRKAMAEKLFERTKEEAEEEKILLEELYRITKNEEDFIKMRKELYSRLETAPSLRRNERGEEPSTAIYQTSQGLSMLLSGLLAKEKRLKSRIAPNGQETAQPSQTPADNHKSRHSAQFSRRETMDSTAGDDHGPPTKKGSISQTPVVRNLAPAEEVKFGVSHPQERLTYGVMFRHEKINRLTMAKSQVQTQKIAAALTELGIPPRLLMPTERVCREFERLVGEVQILLDTRRVLEKVSSEVKVLEEHKKLRLGGAQTEGEDQDQKEGDDSTTQINGGVSTANKSDKLSEATSAAGTVETSSGLETKDKAAIASVRNDDDDDDDGEADENAKPDIDNSQMHDDDDDEEEEEDEENGVDRSALAEDDDDDDDNENDDIDQSYAQQDDEDDEEEVDEDQDEDNAIAIDDEDEEDDDDDDAPGLEDLERAHQVTDDEDGEEDNDIDPSQLADNDEENGDEDEDEGEDDDAQDDPDESIMNGADEDEDDQEAAQPEDEEGSEEVTRQLSPHLNVRGHKRSASVLSDASRAGSSRSGVGRKKAR